MKTPKIGSLAEVIENKTVKLHLWKSDSAQLGGGGVVGMPVFTGLREAGIDSKILCDRKTTDSHVKEFQHRPRLEILEKVLNIKNLD